jgi:hypothetical protein
MCDSRSQADQKPQGRTIAQEAKDNQRTTTQEEKGTNTDSSEGRRHRHEEEDWKSWSGPIGIKKTYLEPDARSAPGLDVNPTTTTSETSILC